MDRSPMKKSKFTEEQIAFALHQADQCVGGDQQHLVFHWMPMQCRGFASR